MLCAICLAKIEIFYLFGSDTSINSFDTDRFSTGTPSPLVNRTVRGVIKYDSTNEQK